jgi:hypothetical protein
MNPTRLNLFADYFQFYLQDESAEGDLSDYWTEEATDRLLAVAPGAVGVGTVRNMEVPVSIEVLDAEPPLDAAEWDHMTECSIQIESGKLVVAGCTDYFPEAMRIPLAPATYAVRVSYGGLATLSADGLDGGDHYRVQLWPGIATEARVVKQRITR